MKFGNFAQLWVWSRIFKYPGCVPPLSSNIPVGGITHFLGVFVLIYAPKFDFFWDISETFLLTSRPCLFNFRSRLLRPARVRRALLSQTARRSPTAFIIYPGAFKLWLMHPEPILYTASPAPHIVCKLQDYRHTFQWEGERVNVGCECPNYIDSHFSSIPQKARFWMRIVRQKKV